MGNQQSAGLEFCNAGQLYTSRNETATWKSDMDTRIVYSLSTEPKFQEQRVQKAHQQVPPQQQVQEGIKESACDSQPPCKYAMLAEDKQKLSTVVQSNRLGKDAKEPSMKKVVHSKIDNASEVIEHSKDECKVFEGVFGNVIINQSGLVLYTDIAGKKYCEEYDRDQICTIFPMGISQGGLSKSIWFKDIVARDDCFDLMSTLRPPSYNTFLANPSKFALPKNDEPEDEDDDEDLMKVFEGIKNRNVIVHADNIVLYTDITGEKHCEHYDKHKIKKCFPNGIHYGGLSKTIWFNDHLERDLCFMLMQWDKEPESDLVVKEPSVTEFVGLNGNVVLHPDSQIEYTSLSNERVKCFYEPREIKESFPKGISYGRLPVTIWFRDIKMRDSCIDAMRKM